MPCTMSQLKSAAKWRDNNREVFRERIRNSRIKHADTYLEKERTRKLKYYYFKKECKRLMEILL